MKHAVFAAVLAALAFPAFAADKVEVPKPGCDPKPEFPGHLAMQSDTRRKNFQHEMDKYKECMVAYIDQRKATAQANTEAANGAVDEFNTTMKKINEGIAAAREQEKDVTSQ
jgi:hypothetical protein